MNNNNTAQIEYEKAAQLEVANEIKRQIGRSALFMIGAKNFIGLTGENHRLGGLTFKIGRNAKKVTHITIHLDYNDTYTIQFFRVWGSKISQLGDFDGVYCDMLHSLIESETGLYTSL